MCAAAVAKGRKCWPRALAAVTIVSTTRSALRRPAQPLKPMDNIAPNPFTQLQTREARKEEIDRQAAANVQTGIKNSTST